MLLTTLDVKCVELRHRLSEKRVLVSECRGVLNPMHTYLPTYLYGVTYPKCSSVIGSAYLVQIQRRHLLYTANPMMMIIDDHRLNDYALVDLTDATPR